MQYPPTHTFWEYVKKMEMKKGNTSKIEVIDIYTTLR